MLGIISVEIHIPFKDAKKSEIPNDYLIGDVVDELVDVLNLPRVTANAVLVEYQLYSLNNRSYLRPEDPVTAALRKGDAIRLDAKSNGEAADIDWSAVEWPSSPTQDDGLGEIQVDLRGLNLNRLERVTFSTARPIGDLIN